MAYSHIIDALAAHLEGSDRSRGARRWGLSALRVFATFGYPHSNKELTIQEYLELGKQNRTVLYQRISSEEACIALLTHNGIPVSASFEITEQWLTDRTNIVLDLPDDEYVGVHCVSIVGFDKQKESLVCDDRFAGKLIQRFIPKGFFDRYLVEAHWQDPSAKLEFEQYEDDDDQIRYRVFRGYIADGFAAHLHLQNDKTDEIIGWFMATLAGSLLYVEDFFVLPEWRGGHIGTHLMARLLKLCDELGAKPYFWIPWADHQKDQRAPFEALMRQIGYHTQPSGYRWAAYKSTDEQPKKDDLTLDWIPERAGLTGAMPKEMLAALEGAWTEEKNDRRLSLIDAKYSKGLSSEEQDELWSLQSQLSAYLNKNLPLPFDNESR